MSYFPQLSTSGITTQRPYTTSYSFRTLQAKPDYNRPFSQALYGGGLTGYPTGPLGSFIVNCPAITDAEMNTLKAFFKNTAVGRLNEFIYIDPAGNLVPYSEDFTQAAWSNATITIISNQTVTDAYGGAKATSVNSTGTNQIQTVIVPAGNLPANFVITGSVWLKAAASAQSATVSIVTDVGGVVSSVTQVLPSNVWTRVSTTYVAAVSNPLSLRISLTNGTYTMFGAQAVAAPAAGGYRKSPASAALRPHCRFDTDSLEYRQVAPNQNSVAVPVIEYNA